MEPLCKFLSFDLYTLLAELFTSLGSVWCMCLGRPKRNCISLTEVTHPSYRIRHIYPKRLVTYDGEAMCEPRLIRFSDLTKSNVTVIQPQCKKEENVINKCSSEHKIKKAKVNDDEECEGKEKEEKEDNDNESGKDEKCKGEKLKCQPKPIIKSISKCSQSMSKASKFSTKKPETLNGKAAKEGYFNYCNSELPNKKILGQQEQQAKKFYQDWLRNSQTPEESNCAPIWESLKPAQKLRFYWRAYTGDELYGTPYENFRQSFMHSFLEAYPNAGLKCLKSEMRRHWWCLDRCQRLPFILQALLYHVSTGAVNPNDHCAVRAMFNRLR